MNKNKPKLNKIINKYPELYKGWAEEHIQCSDGWADIIDEMSQKIIDYLKTNPIKDFTISIKEKYAELTVYQRPWPRNETIEEIIDKASEKSSIVCETCGAPGSLTESDGWMTVACNRHGGPKLDTSWLHIEDEMPPKGEIIIIWDEKQGKGKDGSLAMAIRMVSDERINKETPWLGFDVLRRNDYRPIFKWWMKPNPPQE